MSRYVEEHLFQVILKRKLESDAELVEFVDDLKHALKHHPYRNEKLFFSFEYHLNEFIKWNRLDKDPNFFASLPYNERREVMNEGE